MEIADSHAHRLLTYIEAVSSNHALTSAEFEAYAKGPDIQTGYRFGPSLLYSLAGLHESYLEWLRRLCWAEPIGSVRLTSLGRAALHALNREERKEDHPTHILLEAHDTLSYARLLETLAGAGEALLVDPYFRLDQLADIAEHTNVNRVLTSEKIGEGGVAGLAAGLTAVLNDGRDLKIRLGGRANMHDRYVIPPDDRPVLMLGSSLNTVSRALTMVVELGESAGIEARDRWERIWEQASPIEPIEGSHERSIDAGTASPEDDL